MMNRKNLMMFTTLAFVLSAFVFTGCSKDDDSPSFSQSDLIGTWEFTGGSGTIKENGKTVQEWQISDKTMGDEEDVITDNFVRHTGDVWKFNSDGTGTAMDNVDFFSYSVAENKLIFKGRWYDKWNEQQVEEVVFSIKELKSDKLAVSFLGIAGSYDFYEEYTFKKISNGE